MQANFYYKRNSLKDVEMAKQFNISEASSRNDASKDFDMNKQTKSDAVTFNIYKKTGSRKAIQREASQASSTTRRRNSKAGGASKSKKIQSAQSSKKELPKNNSKTAKNNDSLAYTQSFG